MRLEIRVQIPTCTGKTLLYSYSKILHDGCKQILSAIHRTTIVTRQEKYTNVGQYSEGYDDIRGPFIYRFFEVSNGQNFTKVVWVTI